MIIMKQRTAQKNVYRIESECFAFKKNTVLIIPYNIANSVTPTKPKSKYGSAMIVPKRAKLSS